MIGPDVLVRSLTTPSRRADKFGNYWQYHSRSDRHSKIACWAILVDLLLTEDIVRQHFREGRICFGINHTMRDFTTGKKKNLDLVICTPGSNATDMTLMDMGTRYGVVLTEDQKQVVDTLPLIRTAPVGTVRVALEAKACMTEHRKAGPRLYDELNSSHSVVHGNADIAIAVGFGMINGSTTFLSSDKNKYLLAETTPVYNQHNQPGAVEHILSTLREIPRRTARNVPGFDAFGIVVVEASNDGSPWLLRSKAFGVPDEDSLSYASMIMRIGQMYRDRFR